MSLLNFAKANHTHHLLLLEPRKRSLAQALNSTKDLSAPKTTYAPPAIHEDHSVNLEAIQQFTTKPSPPIRSFAPRSARKHPIASPEAALRPEERITRTMVSPSGPSTAGALVPGKTYGKTPDFHNTLFRKEAASLNTRHSSEESFPTESSRLLLAQDRLLKVKRNNERRAGKTRGRRAKNSCEDTKGNRQDDLSSDKKAKESIAPVKPLLPPEMPSKEDPNCSANKSSRVSSLAYVLRKTRIENSTTDTNTSFQEESYATRPTVTIRVPDHLKALLVDDWENVTKNLSLVPLPSTNPVNAILNTYFDEEKNKRRLGSAENDLLLEVVEGVKEYFEKCVGRILLYRFEREQYFEMVKMVEVGREWEGKGMGDVYGAEHLCRLFGASFPRCPCPSC